jgi:hypothetical protein
MDALGQFESALPARTRRTIARIRSPYQLQEFLLGIPYNAEARNRSPLNVILDKQAHCLDGGFLAALLLWKLGYPPLVVDLLPAPGTDDDHVLAVFRVAGHWGAVAKSNFLQLAFREPVYRSLRELVMSYFEHYFNLERQKTLRAYTRPMDLSHCREPGWACDEAAANRLYARFYRRRPIPLLGPRAAGNLNPINPRKFKAELLDTDIHWVYGARQE